jgi:polyisoprenoid-binding protein YceI
MKPLAVVTAVLALAAPLGFAQTTTWTPDPNHSEVDFTIRHLSLTNVRGHFGKIAGTIMYNSADVTKSSVSVTIDVTGIDTGNASRDNDLKSANYFDAANFPSATFTSTSVAKNATGLTVAGNLTLHGVTKPVTLMVETPVGPVNGMGNTKHMGFSATTTIDRTAFGIGANMPNAMLGVNVQLDIELDAVLQQPGQ